MITEFSYRGKDRSARGVGNNSPRSPGGGWTNPQALRPERLRWLTTSAANRQIRMPNAPLQGRTTNVERGGGITAMRARRSMHAVDTVRSGALEDSPFRHKMPAPERGLRPSPLQTTTEVERRERAFPSFFPALDSA